MADSNLGKEMYKMSLEQKVKNYQGLVGLGQRNTETYLKRLPLAKDTQYKQQENNDYDEFIVIQKPTKK